MSTWIEKKRSQWLVIGWRLKEMPLASVLAGVCCGGVRSPVHLVPDLACDRYVCVGPTGRP